jgi:hypothetical protein
MIQGQALRACSPGEISSGQSRSIKLRDPNAIQNPLPYEEFDPDRSTIAEYEI